MLKEQRYLLTDIYYKNSEEEEWKRWSYTDGDPTGREYTLWYNSNDITIEKVVAALNECITCILEKPIDPYAIKFIRRVEPKPDAINFGYIFMYSWNGEEYIIKKCKYI